MAENALNTRSPAAMKLTVVLSPASDRGYTVVCPALPGAVTEGDTLDEALQNMKEAAESWLMAWLEDGHALPEETPAMIQAEIDQCISDREEEGLPPLIETSEIEVADPEGAGPARHPGRGGVAGLRQG